MVLTFSECIEKYGSKYKIKKLISEGKLYQLEKGIYSEKKYVPEYQIISTKFPKAIFTLNSAFYYHQLTDVIPEKYYLATGRGGSKINDERVIQIFENSDALDFGAEMIAYGDANAQAKVCQDVILKAISASSLSRNVTIKGGVVMRSKTINIRRATQDLDIDFIRYSLANESIDMFVNKLNCIDGLSLARIGDIEELKQQDYHGKRVYIEIKDSFDNVIISKLDLGVHNRLDIEQEEYCFDIAFDEEGASLLINSINDEKIDLGETILTHNEGVAEKDSTIAELKRQLELLKQSK